MLGQPHPVEDRAGAVLRRFGAVRRRV